jgi:hypothetical protein
VGHDYIVWLLLNHAVNIDPVDQNGDAALHFAFRFDTVVDRRVRDPFPLGVKANSLVHVPLTLQYLGHVDHNFMYANINCLLRPPSLDSETFSVGSLAAE